MVDIHWEQLGLGFGYQLWLSYSHKKAKNRITRS